MLRMRLIFFISLFFIGCFEHGLKVDVTVDRREVFAGEAVKYSVAIKLPPAGEVEFVTAKDGGKEAKEDRSDFALSYHQREALEQPEGTLHKQHYFLVWEEAGEKVFPGVPMRYRFGPDQQWMQVNTEPVIIEVKTLFDAGSSVNDIRDIKRPSLPSSLWKHLSIGIIVLIIVICVLWFWFKYRKKDEATEEVVHPIHIIAYQALDALKNKEYISQGFIKEYYSELSDILRSYIEGRFEINSLTMSTPEFLHTVTLNKTIEPKYQQLLLRFLNLCDLVKFAQHLPGQREAIETFEVVHSFVTETKVETPQEDKKQRTH